jgi:hypothetical protein
VCSNLNWLCVGGISEWLRIVEYIYIYTHTYILILGIGCARKNMSKGKKEGEWAAHWIQHYYDKLKEKQQIAERELAAALTVEDAAKAAKQAASAASEPESSNYRDSMSISESADTQNQTAEAKEPEVKVVCSRVGCKKKTTAECCNRFVSGAVTCW